VQVTIVQNVEAYGIDPREFARQIRCKVAGSASAIPSEVKDRGHDVVVQGSHSDVIYQYLLGQLILSLVHFRKIDQCVCVCVLIIICFLCCLE
jgi:translation initiation factor 1 (eIF-1/SUI1)